jgi:hypothetical protein
MPAGGSQRPDGDGPWPPVDLEDLVAGALILYPRYLDPDAAACGPRSSIERLVQRTRGAPGLGHGASVAGRLARRGRMRAPSAAGGARRPAAAAVMPGAA